MVELGRNEPCHCGSGKKYKKCHLLKDEEKERKQLAKQVIKPTGEAEQKPKGQPGAPDKKGGWFNRLTGKAGGFFKPPSHHKAQGGG
jgi:hypothetical protein